MINILFKTSIPSFQYSIIPFNRLNSNVLENSISLIWWRNYDARSLVAKTILSSAIRTRPGDCIAGHSPHVFKHAILANTEPAAARPAKRKRHFTTNAVVVFEASSFFAVCGSGGRRFHDCCFKSLML